MRYNNIQVFIWLLLVLSCLGTFCPWYDRDNPSGFGDNESIIAKHDQDSCLRNCPYPRRQECKTTSGGPVVNKLLNGFDCSYLGLVCVNMEQQGRTPSYCLDYKIRFDCHQLYENNIYNRCYYNNGGCSQICNFPSGSCSCYPGYQLDTDGKTCNGPGYDPIIYCTLCQEYFNPVECGEHTNLDAQPGYTLTMPCRKRCYKSYYDGRWSRGCGEYPPTYPPHYPFTSPEHNVRPPTSDPNYWETTVPTSGLKLKVWLSDGSLSNADGGTSRVIGNHGLIGSPNHPASYPNYVDMYYIIVTRNSVTAGYFQSFNVEGQYSCAWDYVRFLNGGSASSPHLYGKYCSYANNYPPSSFGCSYYPLPTIFTIHFHTDYSVVRTGFKFRYFKC